MFEPTPKTKRQTINNSSIRGYPNKMQSKSAFGGLRGLKKEAIISDGLFKTIMNECIY